MERKIWKHSPGHCTSSGVFYEEDFRKMDLFVWSSDEKYIFFLKFDSHCENPRGSVKCLYLYLNARVHTNSNSQLKVRSRSAQLYVI